MINNVMSAALMYKMSNFAAAQTETYINFNNKL